MQVWMWVGQLNFADIGLVDLAVTDRLFQFMICSSSATFTWMDCPVAGVCLRSAPKAISEDISLLLAGALRSAGCCTPYGFTPIDEVA